MIYLLKRQFFTINLSTLYNFTAVINMINGKSIIGNYSILSELAMGAFGRVYLAQHTVLTNRVVALKLMHTVPLSSQQECNQFLQEARFLLQDLRRLARRG